MWVYRDDDVVFLVFLCCVSVNWMDCVIEAEINFEDSVKKDEYLNYFLYLCKLVGEGSFPIILLLYKKIYKIFYIYYGKRNKV